MLLPKHYTECIYANSTWTPRKKIVFLRINGSSCERDKAFYPQGTGLSRYAMLHLFEAGGPVLTFDVSTETVGRDAI